MFDYALLPLGALERLDPHAHLRVLGLGLGSRGLGFNVGLKVQGLGFRVQSSGLRVEGGRLRIWVLDLGFRVQV